jgi:hypothetical protein
VENEMSNESLIPFLSSTKRASRFKTTPFLESTPAQPTQQTSEVEKVLVDKSTLKDGDVVYDKYGTKFIYRGVREEGKTGAGSPRLERTDGSGEIAIPGINIKLYTQPTQQVSEVDFDKLKEEAKKKGVPIFDLKDWTLKEPIQNGETTITHIIPDPTGGNFKILFDRPTGQWMAKFNLKDGVVQKALFKNEGTKSEPSMISSSKMSEDFMDKSISAAIPADLIASITEDLKNVPPQTDTKLNTKDFAYTESIDKKYGIKKTLGDILQSTTTQPTQQNKPEGLPAIDRTSKKC